MRKKQGSPLVSAVLILTLIGSARAAPAGTLDVALSPVPATPAVAVSGQVPSLTWTFYVPQAGPAVPLTEGADAIQFFRGCPNNEGGSSFPNSARIKVVVGDEFGRAIQGIAAADICILLNGGTAAQGFSGLGADSVIANSQWNVTPLCPDVRCIAADAPTNVFGTTYITFTGANEANPGVGVRNPSRKWGHYDSELPVFVLGLQIPGRITTASPSGSYILRIKSYDWTGGLGAQTNQGEAVTLTDFNGIAGSLLVNNAISYWKDFNSDGRVDGTDLAIVTAHLNHNCAVPRNP